MPYKLHSEELAVRRTKFFHNRKACEVCTLCPNLVQSRQRAPYRKPTYGYGALDVSAIFVGEAPGLHGCATTGIPFTRDRSGKYYQWILKYLGVTKSDVYTTNIVKCWPGDENFKKNRTPTRTEVNNCFPHLLNEIEVIKPKTIVCLGRVPEKIMRERLKEIRRVTLINTEVVYIRHPAYMLRTGSRPGDDNAKQYASEFKPYIRGAEVGKQLKLGDYFGQ